MTRHFDLDLLRTFVTVAESGSMTIAANRLHKTQGAISQQVKRLEDAMASTLLLRHTRRLELSRDGERFLAKARQLLRLNDEIWSEVHPEALHGSLRVGIPYDLVTPLAPAMTTFVDQHPQVEISLSCGASSELNHAVDSGHLDVAVVEDLASAAEGEVIRTEPLVWVAGAESHAWQKRPLPLSMVDERCAFRPVVLKALSHAGIPWRTVFESGSIEATAATVRAGLAVTTCLASTVPLDFRTLHHQTAGLPPLPPFAICLRMPDTAHPAAAAFGTHVRASLSNDPAASHGRLARLP